MREAKERAEKALSDLKAAQERLVQTEKMTFLDQRTAGVAHEIKNPPNLIKNFAEVSTELLKELKENLQPTIGRFKKDKRDDALGQFATIDDMLAKIKEHGDRANSIVQSMLSNSREGPATTRPTDLNALLEENLDLDYPVSRGENSRGVTNVCKCSAISCIARRSGLRSSHAVLVRSSRSGIHRGHAG